MSGVLGVTKVRAVRGLNLLTAHDLTHLLEIHTSCVRLHEMVIDVMRVY